MRKAYAALLCITVLSFSVVSVSDACTNVLITKGASADGSTMVSYAADSHTMYGELYFHPAGIFPKGSMLDIYEWDSGKYMGQIEQVPRTFQTVGNMNDHQVAFTETTFGGREELPNKNGIMDYGSLIFVTLQRAATARDAISIMAGLVKKYGYASEGESFSISDPNEVWIVEILGKGEELGAVWAAVRIPDGYISGHANQCRINKIFKEYPKEDVLYSPDIVSFARKMGWYSGKDEDFSFCDAYCPVDFSTIRACDARVWSAFNILGGGTFNLADGTSVPADTYLDYAMGYNPAHKLPLYIRPDKKVTVKALANVMRDHFEGTPMDMTTDIGAGEHKRPYRWRPMAFELDGKKYVCERAICTQQTGYWMVGQCRSWLPDEVGGILWFGVDDAGTSCLTPIYTNVTRVPECFREGNGSLIEYSPTSAFWEFNRVAQFAYLFYDRVAPEVRAHADKHENGCIAEVSGIDSNAVALLGKGKKKEALACLTDYSVNTAQSMFKEWQSLDIYLLMKYKDGNILRQNADGSFKDNGYSKRIPIMPMQPQHPEHWRRAIVNSNGSILKVPDGR
ncbi:MAG: C69 family dipeptidase [Bacteroidales bacterium]|jgi:dipeptidase|nr:C69 family dipeptidase [Bacteroidales bacterium]MCI2122448.1 C69 family dipeptidase [Bacteroidales bacterium]MCI2145104.1 C69 family dipeptidase [Bacteroidales bacterium]